MKAILSFLILFVSLNTIAQTKKLEVTNTQTGKTVLFESEQRVKITTEDRKKLVGTLTFPDAESIAIDGVAVKLDNIQSVKNFPKKGRTFKNIVIGTGLGLVAGSGVAALASNGSAFALFTAGAGTTILGGLINNGSKTYIKRRCSFKILEQ